MRATTDQARRQVWKYALPSSSIHTETIIKLPATHKIVHVGFDPKDGSVAIWIEVPVPTGTSNPLTGITDEAQKLWARATDEAFRVVPTGSDLPAPLSDSSGQSDDPGPCEPDCLYCDRPHSTDDHAPVARPAGRGWTHIGTAIDIHFGYVWHVYHKR